MSAVKYLVPALAAVGRAAGASCSNSATTTITAAADASGLSSCSTYSGSIAIATGLGDSISIDGVQTITGDLVALNNSNIPSLSADSLETIGGAFRLDTLQVLSTLSFPQLNEVDSIVWNALAGLQGLSFSNGVQKANELNIQNTQLQSLDGINLQVVDTVMIANNPYLNDIEMQLGNITKSLDIESNGDNVSAIFPNLIWAANLTFKNVSQISLASLESVNGSLGFYSNEFTSIECANLTTIGGKAAGDLSFVDNSNLKNISMNALKSVGGGFSIQNNTAYKDVDGFAKLATVAGAVDIYGNFTNVTLPSITEVDGAFNLQSSGDVDCTTFNNEKSKVVRGKYVCKGAVAKPSGVGSNPSSTSGSSSSSTASGAANGMFVPTAAAGLMGVIAAMFGLL